MVYLSLYFDCVLQISHPFLVLNHWKISTLRHCCRHRTIVPNEHPTIIFFAGRHSKNLSRMLVENYDSVARVFLVPLFQLHFLTIKKRSLASLTHGYLRCGRIRKCICSYAWVFVVINILIHFVLGTSK